MHWQPGYEIDAIKYTTALSEAKVLAENSVFETLDEAIAYAKDKGIKKLTVVGEEIKTMNTGV